MRTAMRLMILVAATVGVVTIATPASAADSGIGLAVTTPETAYATGTAVPLSIVVTNRGSAACGLEAAAPGSIHVVSGTRDGKALSPTFEPGLPINTAADAIARQTRSAQPGGRVAFAYGVAAGFGLTAMTPADDGTELMARWPSTDPGTYRFQLVYAMPVIAGTAACAGASNVATVAYTIGAPAARTTWWLWVAGLIVLVAAAWWLLRRRGRAAVTAAVVLAMAGGALVGGFGRSEVADAAVTFHAGSGLASPAASSEWTDCVGLISGFDAPMWKTLNGPDSPTVDVVGWSENVTMPLGGGARNSLIGWAWNDTSRYRLEGPGVRLDPCTDLYHELKHAEDRANAVDDGSICRGSEKFNGGNGVQTEEVRATLQENAFRVAHGLLPRTLYDDFRLPADISSCGPPGPKKHLGTLRCTSSCALSTGDPHLTTFDGTRYTFQGAGEFTAATSTTGDLTVQIRQQPFGTSRTVAVNTAFAVAAGPTHLGFYLDNGTIVVRRGPAVAAIPIGVTTLPGGASVRHTDALPQGDSYDVTWADGTDLMVWRAGTWGLVARLTPSPARRGTMSGLFGDDDGTPTDDLAPRGGGTPVTADALYPAYADGWRIAATSSLFVYPPGQSADTFTDRAFPAKSVPLTAAQIAAVEPACDAVGITDPTELADCELDVAATGQAEFAVAAGATASGGTTTAAATSTLSTASVAAAGAIARIPFAAAAGDRVYVQMASTTLPSECGTAFAIRGPTGTVVADGCIRAGGDIPATLLPVAGAYTVVVDPGGNSTGTADVRISLSRDQTVDTTINGPPVTLAVTTPGGRSSARFAAVAGQKVFIDASAATIPDQCGALGVANTTGGSISLGCVRGGVGYVDTVVLPVAGVYSVVNDPEAGTTGAITIKILPVIDQDISATIDGPAVTASIPRPGAVSRVTFNGTAGQRVQVAYTASTLPGSCGTLAFLGPDGSRIDTACSQGTEGTAMTETLGESGPYTILVDPNGEDLGSISLTVSAVS
jgi:hypothetical protein